MSDVAPPQGPPSNTTVLIDSIKAPFVEAKDAPAANPAYTALFYGGVGLLLGRL